MCTAMAMVKKPPEKVPMAMNTANENLKMLTKARTHSPSLTLRTTKVTYEGDTSKISIKTNSKLTILYSFHEYPRETQNSRNCVEEHRSNETSDILTQLCVEENIF